LEELHCGKEITQNGIMQLEKIKVIDCSYYGCSINNIDHLRGTLESLHINYRDAMYKKYRGEPFCYGHD